jgi:hypothetical protein
VQVTTSDGQSIQTNGEDDPRQNNANCNEKHCKRGTFNTADQVSKEDQPRIDAECDDDHRAHQPVFRLPLNLLLSLSHGAIVGKLWSSDLSRSPAYSCDLFAVAQRADRVTQQNRFSAMLARSHEITGRVVGRVTD